MRMRNTGKGNSAPGLRREIEVVAKQRVRAARHRRHEEDA